MTRRKQPRKHPEDDFHMAVASYLDLALPEEAVWTTIPAGGGGTVRGARLKRMGYKAGFPDLQIFYRGRVICMELKSEKGRLSKAQEAMHEQLTLAGALVYTARRIEEVEGFLRAIMPLRATTGAV